MTLRDLLKKCRYKDVFNVLHQEYYKNHPQDDIYRADYSYRKVFEELLLLPQSPAMEYKIYIRRVRDGSRFRIDTSFYCEEDEQVYALDLTPWGHLIDSEIKEGVALSPDVALAHILWELTFYGFSQGEITTQKKNLLKKSRAVTTGRFLGDRSFFQSTSYYSR